MTRGEVQIARQSQLTITRHSLTLPIPQMGYQTVVWKDGVGKAQGSASVGDYPANPRSHAESQSHMNVVASSPTRF